MTSTWQRRSGLNALLVVCLSTLIAFALAQAEGKPLVIGGAQLRASYPGSPNVSYAPLTDLVRVLGLEWQVSSDAVTLSQGGRVVRITLAPSAADGSYYSRALSVNGEGRRGQAAGMAGDTLMLPVRTVAVALDGELKDEGDRLVFTLPQAKLKDVRSKITETADRAVLELSRDAGFAARLEGSDAVVFVPGARGEPGRYTVGGPYIQEVEVRNIEGGLEARIRLPKDAGFSTYARPAGDGLPARIVLDVSSVFGRNVPALSQRPVRVVLDPGRGGSDIGVTGGGLAEKSITLNMARLVGQNLKAKGVNLGLTRNGDSNPTLDERRAKSLTSDVFVSFSVASLTGSTAKGVTIYTPATEARSSIVASGRSSLAGEKDETRRRLLERFLSPGEASAALAQAIAARLKGIEELPVDVLAARREVVISEAPGAAILIELGWLSDEKDRIRLMNSLAPTAEAISEGILEHLAPSLARAGTTGGNR